MTPIRVSAEALAYELAVMMLYLDLPETSRKFALSHRQQAQRWFAGGVPLWVAETALVLGSLRRLTRSAPAPPLTTIRSLAYFQPVVEELLAAPVPDGYRTYLQRRIQPYLRSQAEAQTSTG